MAASRMKNDEPYANVDYGPTPMTRLDGARQHGYGLDELVEIIENVG